MEITSKTIKYRPSPYDIMSGIMFHLSMGNKNIDLNSHFWIIEQFVFIKAVKIEVEYARVMTISPTRIVKLEIDETTTKCIEDLLDNLLNIYNDYASFLQFEDALKLVCRDGQCNGLIPNIMVIDLEFLIDFFHLIVSNMLIAMSFMKSAIKNVYASRYMECKFI